MIVATEPTLREAAAANRKPFLWLPPSLRDSLPPGKSLAHAYKNCGKPFLLAPRGTAGVYSGDSHWLIPPNVSPNWIRKHLAPLIAISDFLPQSAQTNRFLSAGDLGDVIASLPAVRAVGVATYVLTDKGSGRRESLRGARYEALKPLLEAQAYISHVEWQDDPEDITHDITMFRESPRTHQDSLATWQARYLEVEITLEPWLTVPKVESNDRVVVARSARYHNQFFPWQQIVRKYRDEMVFVGLPEEHKAFCREVGWQVTYQPTANLLELAELIAGCRLFLGNQSAPFWVAAGLGVPLIQETWDYDQNSIVQRDNARYTMNGPETRTLIYTL